MYIHAVKQISRETTSTIPRLLWNRPSSQGQKQQDQRQELLFIIVFELVFGNIFHFQRWCVNQTDSSMTKVSPNE